MVHEGDEAEERVRVSAGLVTSAVMGVMLLILAAFLAQLPETRSARTEVVAGR